MAWIKISDDYDENSKFDHVGALGVSMWLGGMAYCNRNLTDGLIHRSRAGRLADFTGLGFTDEREGQNPTTVTVALMLESGLWHADGHDCDKCIQPSPHHFVVHDYLEYQPSREKVLADREAGTARKAAWRQGRKKKSSQQDIGGSHSNASSEALPESRGDGHGDIGRSHSNASGGASTTPVSRTPSTKNPLSDESDQTGIPERFEEFWDTYGKKRGRPKSIQKYRLALKKPGVTAELLIAAAAEYVAWVKSEEGKWPEFAKDPATWLNGEHWTDERAARDTDTAQGAFRPTPVTLCRDNPNPHAPHPWTWGADNIRCPGIEEWGVE